MFSSQSDCLTMHILQRPVLPKTSDFPFAERYPDACQDTWKRLSLAAPGSWCQRRPRCGWLSISRQQRLLSSSRSEQNTLSPQGRRVVRSLQRDSFRRLKHLESNPNQTLGQKGDNKESPTISIGFPRFIVFIRAYYDYSSKKT